MMVLCVHANAEGPDPGRALSAAGRQQKPGHTPVQVVPLQSFTSFPAWCRAVRGRAIQPNKDQLFWVQSRRLALQGDLC